MSACCTCCCCCCGVGNDDDDSDADNVSDDNDDDNNDCDCDCNDCGDADLTVIYTSGNQLKITDDSYTIKIYSPSGIHVGIVIVYRDDIVGGNVSIRYGIENDNDDDDGADGADGATGTK